jgi:L-asparagine transporter-like permease
MNKVYINFFRLTRILLANTFAEHYEPMVKNSYLPKNAVYSFQFYQYSHNCSVRNYFESMSVIILTILYQFIIYAYVTFTKEDVTHPTTHYYYKCQVFTNVLMLLSLLNYVFSLIYFNITGRNLRKNIMEILVFRYFYITFAAHKYNYLNKYERNIFETSIKP